MSEKPDFSPAEGLFTLGVLALLLNNLALPGMGNGEFALKLHHLVSALVCLYALFLMGTTAVRPRIDPILWLFHATIIATSLVAYLANGFNVFLYHYFYIVIASVGYATLAAHIGFAATLRAIRAAFALALLLVWAKNLAAAGSIAEQLQAGGRVYIYNLVAGGPNQEASWLALGAAAFIGHRRFWPYFLSSLALACLYISRGALVIHVLILAAALSGLKSRLSLFFLALTLLVGAILLALHAANGATGLYLLDRLIERFFDWHDPGNEGRYSYYRGAAALLSRNIFGHGIMNAVPLMDRLGFATDADNVHNIYLQFTLDGGVQSLALYLTIACACVLRLRREGLANPLLLLILAYMVLGLVRFRGYDPLIFIFITLCLHHSKAEAAALRPRPAGGG